MSQCKLVLMTWEYERRIWQETWNVTIILNLHSAAAVEQNKMPQYFLLLCFSFIIKKWNGQFFSKTSAWKILFRGANRCIELKIQKELKRTQWLMFARNVHGNLAFWKNILQSVLHHIIWILNNWYQVVADRGISYSNFKIIFAAT